MKGININCKYQEFVQQILNGEKVMETRNTHSLRPFVGKRIGLIQTGKGTATLLGYATITEERHYRNSQFFYDDYNLHKVKEDSKYRFEKEKYGYILKNVVRCKPKPVTSFGIIARNI